MKDFLHNDEIKSCKNKSDPLWSEFAIFLCVLTSSIIVEVDALQLIIKVLDSQSCDGFYRHCSIFPLTLDDSLASLIFK